MDMDLLLNGALDGEDHYAQFLRFVQDCNHISYSQFDSYILNKVNLFALPDNYNFDVLDQILDKIIATLPAIKRIFAKPITHIKNYAAVLPAEAVRSINNHTISHASIHSELWENITEEGLKPRKLLTQDHQDNYVIYENIIFSGMIEMILTFVGKNIRFLKQVLYANRNLNFNLLERDNHLSYFLAIGKLHTGYVRDRDEYCAAAEIRLNRLMFVDRVLRSRINSAVYKQCRGRSGSMPLKKTNVFRMHKDYRRIYVLLKWFLDKNKKIFAEVKGTSQSSGEGYLLYCSLLSLFAVGHFNFSFEKDQSIDFCNLNVCATFGSWQIKIETVACRQGKALRFTFFKDIPYKVMLFPTADKGEEEQGYENLCQKYEVQEYLVASPVENREDAVLLSLFDIESFRRIQQILLRGMIYSDAKWDICPFCGKPLEINEQEKDQPYECRACRTQIFSLVCPKTESSYFATKIKNHILPQERGCDGLETGRMSCKKQIEFQMHFRNITKIGEHNEIVCPKCRHIHV